MIFLSLCGKEGTALYPAVALCQRGTDEHPADQFCGACRWHLHTHTCLPVGAVSQGTWPPRTPQGSVHEWAFVAPCPPLPVPRCYQCGISYAGLARGSGSCNFVEGGLPCQLRTAVWWVVSEASGPDDSFGVCSANTFTTFPGSRHPCGPWSTAVWEGEATRAMCLSQAGKCSLCPSGSPPEDNSGLHPR